MKRSKKSFFVQNLTEELISATSVVLIDFTGLSVKMQQDLKKKLSEVSSKMLVVKNTLFKLAGQKANFSDETLSDSVLRGPTALVIANDDPIAPLQVIADFAKSFDLPQLKVGVVEGSFQDKKELLTLSKLPSKSALQIQVVSAVGGPLYGLIGTLQGNLQKLIYIVDQAKQSKTD